MRLSHQTDHFLGVNFISAVGSKFITIPSYRAANMNSEKSDVKQMEELHTEYPVQKITERTLALRAQWCLRGQLYSTDLIVIIDMLRMSCAFIRSTLG